MNSLMDEIIVTCECGIEMIPVIEGPDEILYICNNARCSHQPQINVSRKNKQDDNK